MPKINAPTVREHHEIVKKRLIDATERILREQGPDALSAGAVAKEAGIARNSIYRYVDSVDDLRLLMLARYMPRWRDFVFSAVDRNAAPELQLEQFMVASVHQTGESSHGWLMSVVRTPSSKRGGRPADPAARPKVSDESAAIRRDVADIHTMIVRFMQEQWAAMDVNTPAIWGGMAGSLLYESFKQVERGANVDEVASALGASVRALTQAAKAASREG